MGHYTTDLAARRPGTVYRLHVECRSVIQDEAYSDVKSPGCGLRATGLIPVTRGRC